jgi:hypothetical protein
MLTGAFIKMVLRAQESKKAQVGGPGKKQSSKGPFAPLQNTPAPLFSRIYEDF